MKYILHVGYHKTGTTFLQENIFSRLDENYVIYLGKPWVDKNIKLFFSKFYSTHDIDFDSNYFSAELNKYILEKFKNNNRKMILISSEGLLTGSEYFGRDILRMIDRIKKVFGECKIIFGIRNQFTYINSFYKQYILEGGNLSFKDFLYSKIGQHSLLPKLKYDKVIEYLYKIFGKNNVYIYLQEELMGNSKSVISEILKFTGHPNFDFEIKKTNISPNDLSIEIIRIINIFSNNNFPLGRNKNNLKQKIRNKLVSEIVSLRKINFFNNKKTNKVNKSFINEYFNESNKNLSYLLKKDLKKYKYY